MLAEVLSHGRLTVIYDNKIGVMFGRGLWESKRETALRNEIRRCEQLLRLLGLEINFFRQKSQRKYRHWVVEGNKKVDEMANFSRKLKEHFIGPGELCMGVWRDTGYIERPVAFVASLTTPADLIVASEMLVDDLVHHDTEGELRQRLKWRRDDHLSSGEQPAQGLHAVGLQGAIRGILGQDLALQHVQRAFTGMPKAARWSTGIPWNAVEKIEETLARGKLEGSGAEVFLRQNEERAAAG